MIKTLTHHYRRMPNVGKLLLGILFFLGVFVTTFKFMYADSIPFESSLSTMFPWLNTGYYSNTHFKYGGNNFVGIIFWSGSETLSTPQNITISSGLQSINCSTHLRGIYYNNQRGRRIWPLDTGNLNILQTTLPATGYNDMSMTGGFYSDCVLVSGTHTPLLNEVYGQIDHYLSGGQSFRMIAGINYNFTGNTFSGLLFGHTLAISTGGVHQGHIFDTNGGIAELSMNLPRCGSFDVIPVLPNVIPVGGMGTFMCQGNSIGGYRLNIFTSTGVSVYSELALSNTGTTQIRSTGSGLPAGNYYATCTILFSGSLVGPQCGSNTPFQVGTGSTPPAGTGCNPNFQGEINFASYNGSTVINPSLGTYYTNKTGIILQWAATEPTNFAISGNFTESVFTGYSPWTSIFNFSYGPIHLSYENTWNDFSSIFMTGSCTYTDAAKRVFVDTQAPTAPVITAPINGANFCSSNPIVVTRIGSTDSGSQVSHYKYEIYSNSGMVTGLLLSGTVNAPITTTTISATALPLGTHYMRIQAVDNVSMISSGSIVSFTTSLGYCPAGTGVVIVTPVIWLRNLDLEKVYRSDPILILGLTGPTLVTISKGMLFVNNGTGIGTTGMVTSADTLYIELISSDEYDTTVSSNLTILGTTGTFSLTTKKSNCVLSTAEKLTIQNIYENLKDEYNNDISKLSDFLNTFQSMVEDESELSNSCTLEYLLQLIEDDLGFDGSVDTSNHITPNCKEYSIGYDAAQRAYYAPEMINRYYFVNRESLIRHIDYYNPGDCHINTYGNNFRTPNDDSDPMKHIAPNGKIYHLVEQYGGFSATEFGSSKYFDSIESIARYIDLRNPPKEIWTHTVDTAFTPITFAAPNGKEYRIFNTDRGFMSYKLMKVKYYTTLSELKNYINRNNPSKR